MTSHTIWANLFGAVNSGQVASDVHSIEPTVARRSAIDFFQNRHGYLRGRAWSCLPLRDLARRQGSRGLVQQETGRVPAQCEVPATASETNALGEEKSEHNELTFVETTLDRIARTRLDRSASADNRQKTRVQFVQQYSTMNRLAVRGIPVPSGQSIGSRLHTLPRNARLFSSK